MRNGHVRVSRWHSGVVAAVSLLTAGIFAGSAPLLLAAIVPLTYLGYAALSSVPSPEAAVSLEREWTPKTPLPGERIEVTLTVRNDAERTLPDVRVADAVPDTLEVIDGDSTAAMTLRAGEETTLEYTLQPRRGTYVFGAPWVRLRSLSATAVSTDEVSATGDDELECRVPLDGLPVHRETIPFAGSVASDSGGPGYEFHSTREYQQGDPLSRINWRRYARTGELGTVQYREQESTNVVIVVDGRPEAGLAPAAGRPDGLTLAAYAAIVTSTTLSDGGHNVGLVGLGIRGRTPGVYTGPPAYVEPGTGADVGGRIARVCDAIAARASGTTLLGSDPSPHLEQQEQRQQNHGEDSDHGQSTATSNDHAPLQTDGRGGAAGAGRTAPTHTASPTDVDHLDALLPTGCQLVLCTPAVDDEIIEYGAALRRRGYRMSVVSPDVTGADTVGARVAAVTREARLERLRRLDVPVADWDPETPLVTALGRGFGEVIH
ncbi:DUF58 domain-containing protein [Natronolimnobius baerhuensis]|uniref:DUF58 domain-containing protein n=1 Tax=Natronolimnobius baerhuensis TaxID=253108 RepID=A0A202E611_9EURY|nr:DUF58 domain-containing protein [Natronolimnobius baerhuensis]OVE83712.1 hypothetical protein B2G88_14895 [Natronolimnobius baerhuensis]